MSTNDEPASALSAHGSKWRKRILLAAITALVPGSTYAQIITQAEQRAAYCLGSISAELEAWKAAKPRNEQAILVSTKIARAERIKNQYLDYFKAQGFQPGGSRSFAPLNFHLKLGVDDFRECTLHERNCHTQGCYPGQ